MWLLIKNHGSYSLISQIFTNPYSPHQKPYLPSVLSSFSNWMCILLALNSPWFNLCFCFSASNYALFLLMFFFCNCILALLLDCKLHQGGYFFIIFTHCFLLPMHISKTLPSVYKRRCRLFKVYVFKNLSSLKWKKKKREISYIVYWKNTFHLNLNVSLNCVVGTSVSIKISSPSKCPWLWLKMWIWFNFHLFSKMLKSQFKQNNVLLGILNVWNIY